MRRRTEQPRDALAIIGIDDFAFRRGQRYGRLSRSRTPQAGDIAARPEQATSQAYFWATHLSPSSRVTEVADMASDRRGDCATPTDGRSYLMENVARLDAVSKSMRQIRKTVGSTIIDPKLLTHAERLQYEGYLRRQETNEAILELSKQGVPIKQIVKRTGHSRKLVRCGLRGQRSDMFRVRQSSLEEWLPWLDGRWDQGARNASALWREMRKKAFVARSASSLNGRGADALLKGPIKAHLPARLQHEASPGS